LDDIPKAFSLPPGETQSREIPTLPDRVIREVVANAAMHRDYRVHGSIQLIRYSNRLEIRNPGYSLKAPERLGEPGSDTRNPVIAAVLHDLKLAETKGSGIRVMREELKARGLQPPLLESDRTGNSFMAILLFHHFLSDEDLRWLSSLGVDRSEAEMRAMVQAREVGAIDNATFRELNRNVDTLTASKQLRRLCEMELLVKKGKGPKTYYEPTEKALAGWPPTGSEPPELGAKSPELGAKSPELGAESPELGAESPDLGTETPMKITTGGGAKRESASHAELPDELRQMLDGLGGKEPKQTMLDATLALLQWRALSVAELAGYLNREPDHLRKSYLKELLLANLVRPLYPDRPNDPRQKYCAVSGPPQ
jgi:ATP-dependent DNA helicase RecG